MSSPLCSGAYWNGWGGRSTCSGPRKHGDIRLMCACGGYQPCGMLNYTLWCPLLLTLHMPLSAEKKTAAPKCMQFPHDFRNVSVACEPSGSLAFLTFKFLFDHDFKVSLYLLL